MRLKPFLGITDQDESTVTVGLTDRYRLTTPKQNEPGFWEKVASADLVVASEEYPKKHSRTVSYLSLFTTTPAALLSKLMMSRILILGCGGLGSRLAIELAALEVRKLTVTDPDTLDESNVARMPYFSVDDVGEYKTDLLGKYLHKGGFASVYHGESICSLEFCKIHDLKEFDFVFITADGHLGNFVDHVGPILADAEIPHLPTGYWESTLVVGPLSINSDISQLRKSPCAYERRIIQRDFVPPSVGFANSIVVGVAMNEMVKYFAAHSETLLHKQWQLDVVNLKSRVVSAADL